MIRKDPTPRQRQIIAFIEEFIEENTYPPTVREIAKGVRLASTATVHGHLERMAEKELLTFKPGSPRSIRLLNVPVEEKQSLTEENEHLRTILKEIKESAIGYTLPTRFENQLNQLIDKALKGETA